MRPPRPALRPDLVAAMVLVVALAGCSGTGEPPPADAQPVTSVEVDAQDDAQDDAPSDGGPRLSGSPTEIHRSDDPDGWTVAVQPSDVGLCLIVRDSQPSTTEGCGYEVPERAALGFVVHDGADAEPGSPDVVAGLAAAAVATIRIEADGGFVPVEVATKPLPGDEERTSWAVELDADHGPLTVLALGPEGEEIERRP